MGEIRLAEVTKTFPGGTVAAVDNVTLDIDDSEFVVLVGPSGCGKTTLLRMIAGLEAVDSGSILIDGAEAVGVPAKERDIAMVFQNYALYPHMTVEKNLGYGLKVRKTPRGEIKRRVAEVARMLGLEELLERRPASLSGGQRQRVAMGRAIIREPAALLMDEPLSNLDAKLRVEMRAELARRHERLGVTTVYVTHDQVEAMTLGEKVVVMRQGRFQQVDTPQRLYREPANLFVAAFIGSPSMNLVDATLSSDAVEFGGFRIPLTPAQRPSARAGQVVLGIRPEAFQDLAFSDPELPRLEVGVDVIEDLGADVHVIFRVDSPRVDIEDVRAAAEEADVAPVDDDRASFTARVDSRTAARVGDRVTLTVDPGAFHFFDRATGRSLL